MRTHAGYRRRNHWLYVDDSVRLGNSVIGLASTSGPTANRRDWFQGETGYVSLSLALRWIRVITVNPAVCVREREVSGNVLNACVLFMCVFDIVRNRCS